METKKFNLKEDNLQLYEKLKKQRDELAKKLMILDKNALNIRQLNDPIEKLLVETELMIELLKKYNNG